MVYLALKNFGLLDHYCLVFITGAALQMHLQPKVLRSILRVFSDEVYREWSADDRYDSSVSPSGSVEARAAKLAEVIEQKCKGKSVNIIASVLTQVMLRGCY